MWNIIYFPLALIGYKNSDSTILYAVMDYIRGLLFVGEHYNSWILWYLLSTTYSLIFIAICKKYCFSNKQILGIGTFLWLWAVALTLVSKNMLSLNSEGLNSIVGIFIKFFLSGRIFTGIFYIPLGMTVYKMKKWNWKGSVILIISEIILHLATGGRK